MGVAWNFLWGVEALQHRAKADQSDFPDFWGVFGRKVVRLVGTVTKEFGVEPPEPRDVRLLMDQARLVNRIVTGYRESLVIGFTPFYFWPLIRGKGVIRVHVEQSKGGRHHELASERGRLGLREVFVAGCVVNNFLWADRIVFPSFGALELFKSKNPLFRGVIGSKVAVIHNGVAHAGSPAFRDAKKSGPLKIVNIAQHVPEKGIELAIEACRRMEGAEFILEQYGGEAIQTPQLEKAASGMTVRFNGSQPREAVLKALSQADVMLHTPREVVFDLALLEAMMLGVPVVATDLAGNREALGEEYPLLGRSVEELARHLNWVVKNRQEAHRLGADLQRRAQQKFTAERMLEGYLALGRESHHHHFSATAR